METEKQELVDSFDMDLSGSDECKGWNDTMLLSSSHAFRFGPFKLA